ncbi:MAG TPA: dTDP-glucose 4,6-dehydratase [Tepidisphaeraceae bacterium]|jgi:dTDP-glucose 4,6-dehydratase|nr:dTDP-glucose 4,6-dehydratase [Tepidisphaeraceae bacterium]
MRTILVTGAAGFIGSNFVRMLVSRNEPVKLIAFDKLTYAGNIANLADLLEKAGESRLVFVKADICDPDAVARTFDQYKVTEVIHFAAESHVDRSILGSGPFIQTNVAGTQVLLDAAKAKGVSRFLQVGTDEVYGTLPEDEPEIKFTEETPLAPNSPYSASKAAADCLVRSYFHTFHLPVLITRCSNNYGPYHFPEKLIPLFVTNLMEGKKVPLYGDGLNIRDWLYVEDHCEALWAVLNKGTPGDVYNIGGNNEITNRNITETILRLMGKDWDENVQYVKDRPGHDRRYAIDASKIKRELGWEPKRHFEEAIQTTIQWYRDNEKWWRSIKSGEYLKYYDQQYAGR